MAILVSSFEFMREKAEKWNLVYNIKRAIFPLIIGTLIFSGLFFSSSVAYVIFYWSYVPSVAISKSVHLQFGHEAPPWGYIDLQGTNLLSEQPYATFVELELPRTRNNLEIGNFMVSLTFLTSFNQTIATSSRPAILTYTSPIIATSLTLLNSPLIIAGFRKESETLLIPVMERFEFASPRGSRPSWAYLEITARDNRIQVYSTKLMFVAQFEGVRWFMYSHRIVAYFLFTSLFFISSSLFATLMWLVFSLHSSSARSVADDLRNGTVSTDENRKDNIGPESRADDDLTVSASEISNPPFIHSSPGASSRAYPQVTETPVQEEYRQSHRPGPSNESSSSGLLKDEDATSSVSQIRTDEELTADGKDGNIENIEAMESNF